MSFFSKMAATYRAVNEGRTTAEAHQMAESFLETKLPYDVGAHGYEIVSKIADYSSVEQMAMIYVVTYANRMEKYLPAVNATPEFRMTVARSVARACILLARLQRSGTAFDGYWTRQLIEAAKKHGVKTDGDQISFAV
jgi:Tfp pilus assembly protein PilW